MRISDWSSDGCSSDLHAELPTWMQAADLLCLPSHSEGVPNVVLEAMSCGLPVVATRVGGIPEVLPDLAGIMVPPRDVPALAAALAESMSRDWSTAAITGHAGRFTWNDNITRLDGVLRASVGQRSEEHTSELQSLMRISYAVFCL